MGWTAEFIIQYRDSEGAVTQRRISDVQPEDRIAVSAYCHLRQARRTFVFSKIICAADAETGEVVDLAVLLGLKTASPSAQPRALRSASELRLLHRGSAADQRQRQIEKRALWKPFRLEVFADLFKDRLFGQFEHRCARCDGRWPLDLDHHVPTVLGGRLVPGNLGALCRRCNIAKSDSPTDAFYSPAQLRRVESLLLQQPALFAFEFDWKRWEAGRSVYLLDLGVNPALVQEMFSNPEHRWYMASGPEIGFEISADWPTKD